MSFDDLPPEAREAMTVWPLLAEAAGLPVEVNGLEVLLHRNRSVRHRAVLAFEAGGRALVLKRDAAPWQPEHFAACVEALRAAGSAVPEAVPQVLAARPDLQTVLMERVPGRALDQLMETAEGPQEMRRLFRRGAEWLGRFQRATTGPPSVFEPGGMVRRHARLRDEIAQGVLHVFEPAAFRAASQRFGTLAEALSGVAIARSAAHGDLHPGNLLLGERRRVWAIDFNPQRLTGTGDDLADYVLNFARRFIAPKRQPAGSWLPEAERRALARGYGSDPFAEPLTDVLMLAAVLRRWIRITPQDGAADEKIAELKRLTGRAHPDLW